MGISPPTADDAALFRREGGGRRVEAPGEHHPFANIAADREQPCVAPKMN